MQKEQSNESKHTKSFSNGNYLNTVAFLGAVIAIGWSIYCRIPSSISISNDTENIPILNNDYDKILEKGIEYEVEKLPVFHRRSNLYNITAFNHCDADEMTTCVKDVMTFNEREITGELDPNLTPMTYSIYKSDGTIEKGNTLVYKRPSISTFYPDFGPDANISPMKPRFNGFAAKFFNLSPWFLKLYWCVINLCVLCFRKIFMTALSLFSKGRESACSHVNYSSLPSSRYGYVSIASFCSDTYRER